MQSLLKRENKSLSHVTTVFTIMAHHMEKKSSSKKNSAGKVA